MAIVSTISIPTWVSEAVQNRQISRMNLKTCPRTEESDKLSEWLNVCLVDWHIDSKNFLTFNKLTLRIWQTHCMNDYISDWLTDRLTKNLTEIFNKWLNINLTCWLNNNNPYCHVDCLTNYTTHWPAESVKLYNGRCCPVWGERSGFSFPYLSTVTLRTKLFPLFIL